MIRYLKMGNFAIEPLSDEFIIKDIKTEVVVERYLSLGDAEDWVNWHTKIDDQSKQ